MKPIVKIVLANNINNIQTLQGQQTTIDGPFVVMSLPFMPSAASFSMMVMMTNLDLDMTYNIRITMYSEENPNKLIFDSGESLIGPFRDSGMIEIDNLNLDLKVQNIPIKYPGKQVIKCSINNYDFYDYFIINHKPVDDE